MISVIFHDIFSRFPEGIEQTEDEGKVLSYEEFEMTSEYLKKNNIDSFSENLPDDLKNRGVYCSSKYDKVIVISRSIVVEQMLWGLVYSNVYGTLGSLSHSYNYDYRFTIPSISVIPSITLTSLRSKSSKIFMYSLLFSITGSIIKASLPLLLAIMYV